MGIKKFVVGAVAASVVGVTFSQAPVDAAATATITGQFKTSVGSALVLTTNGTTYYAKPGANGKFTVKYHVAAQDGHVVKGEDSFTVQSDIAVASPIGNSDTDQGKDAGPNLLVRLVGTAILGGLALILLRRARL